MHGRDDERLTALARQRLACRALCLLSQCRDDNGGCMREIPVGAKGEFTLVVQPEHLANRFKDAALPPVLATPVMIMENAALNAIKPYLEPGKSAVGTGVHICHLAPTPVGAKVVGEAEVTGIEDRRIFFVVRASDDKETIGTGAHERMIIDLTRLARRLDAKRPL
jgi:fluoroacetyl-CoA thioesterase